ncbi:MAG: hypothetical protein QM731_20640 [Chitinophagaceae bacterium]
MKKLFVLFMGLMAGRNVVAQFTDSTQHYVSFASTGVINKTNTSNSYVLNNTAKFSARKKKVSFNSFANWIYGNNESGLTNNDATVTVDATLNSSVSHLYYWALANYTSSYSLKINHQFQTGGGAAYEFLHLKNATANISEGVLFETNDLYIDTVRDKYVTFRNSLRLRFRVSLQDLLVLDGTGFWQPSFSDGSDYIVKTNSSLTIKLRKWLGITAALTYNRFNRNRKENLLFNYGITMEKYF